MLQNLHTHTVFCDGKDTPEEMIDTAISRGFDSLGFSMHASTNPPCKYSGRNIPQYFEELNRLKKKYEGKIEIFTGTELDYFSHGVVDVDSYEYTIASVHFGFKDGVRMEYDYSANETQKYITELYGGDSAAYARDYYGIVATVADRFPKATFIGHFDLITKFNEKAPGIIDTENAKYKSAAIEALVALKEKNEFFEVNTGAISRGYRTTPYPAPFILDKMKEIGCKLVLTSDCHDRRFIDCHFNESKEYLLAHGIDTLYYLTKNGFIGEKIKTR